MPVSRWDLASNSKNMQHFNFQSALCPSRFTTCETPIKHADVGLVQLLIIKCCNEQSLINGGFTKIFNCHVWSTFDHRRAFFVLMDLQNCFHADRVYFHAEHVGIFLSLYHGLMYFPKWAKSVQKCSCLFFWCQYNFEWFLWAKGLNPQSGSSTDCHYGIIASNQVLMTWEFLIKISNCPVHPYYWTPA